MTQRHNDILQPEILTKSPLDISLNPGLLIERTWSSHSSPSRFKKHKAEESSREIQEAFKRCRKTAKRFRLVANLQLTPL